MRVWWCEEHDMVQRSVVGQSETACDAGFEVAETERCRMVEKQLVPIEALVIEKVDGHWPAWVHPAAIGVEVLALDDQGEFEAPFGVLVSSDELNRVLDAIAESMPGMGKEVS